MGMMDKWKDQVSRKEEAAIEKAIEEQRANRGKYIDVPEGKYPVAVEKLEVSKATWGADQITIQFKITEGEYKGSSIFYNGSFDEHFTHGINSTAILLADMLDDEELTASKIAVILSKWNKRGGMDIIDEFLADAAEEMENFTYDLDYQIQESSKINERTGKPYVNKFFDISDIYDK